MGYQFTPAVDRALEAASLWTSANDGIAGVLSPVEIVCGLLQEPECRAARLLITHGVDIAAITSHVPQLIRLEPAAAHTFAYRGLAVEIQSALRAAAERLDESPRTFQFATEHLLLGLTLADDETGRWLRERGVTPEAIEADQAERFGGERTPITVDLSPIPLAEVATTTITEPSIPRPAAPRDLHGAVLRVIDASANRAGEALRVVEDYVRFVLDDPTLMRFCKEMRHELAAALAGIPIERRLAARDTLQDVGTAVTTATEMTRGDAVDVAGANLRRLQESLRSLEEYAKLLDPTIAIRCEQLRYRSYTLQQAVVAAGQGRPKLQDARVYVLLDGGASPAIFAAKVQSLVAAGVGILQLRDKQLDDRTLLARGKQLRELTLGTATRFIMNDRPDLALLAEADGVHIGQEELSVGDARKIVGPDRLIGVSTHTIEQARQAVLDGADYLGVGPTFPSTTKSFAAFPGLEFVRAVAAEIHLPAFAIGGITLDNVDEVVQAGLRCIAVSGAVAQADDPAAVVRELRRRLDRT